jgi:hypothetical protein
MFTLVDGRAFRIATPAYFFQRESGLYQAEATGFVSAALVLLRLVAEIGSSLIIWRLVFLLLGKTGITLVELCRVVDMRLPTLSGFGSTQHLYWSLFAVIIVVLVWPSSIAAPLANSSLQWIPSSQLVHPRTRNYDLPDIRTQDAWNSFLYPEDIVAIALRAATMGARDSDYAFSATQATQRRYMYLDPHLPSESLVLTQMPYFEVSNIEWMNVQFDSETLGDWKPSSLANASMQELPANSKKMGNLGFWMTEKWNFTSAKELYKKPTTFYENKRNVSVLVGRIGLNKEDDADLGTNTTQCSSKPGRFGQLPIGVSQFNSSWFLDGEWTATDCFLVAEVTMRIGMIKEQNYNITLVGASENLHVASPLNGANQSQPDLIPDLAILPTLDMMTDVLQHLVSLGVGSQHREDNVQGYLAGMLTVAYHATRSALVEQATDSTTTITAIPSEPIVRALVNRRRLYVWLALNATLTLAALLLWVVQSTTTKTSKTVRDPTLVALTTNMDAVCHKNGDGLCNAVALSGGDKKLGRMVWDYEHGGSCRKLRFASGGGLDENTQTFLPLLSLRQYNKLPDH